MPLYEYWCEEHGVFEAIRPMSEFSKPAPCPDCGHASARIMLTPPRRGSSDRATIAAHATNERAADSPKRLSEHGPGCSCCGGAKAGRKTLHRPDGSKSFPLARPWMISH